MYQALDKRVERPLLSSVLTHQDIEQLQQEVSAVGVRALLLRLPPLPAVEWCLSACPGTHDTLRTMPNRRHLVWLGLVLVALRAERLRAQQGIAVSKNIEHLAAEQLAALCRWVRESK